MDATEQQILQETSFFFLPKSEIQMCNKTKGNSPNPTITPTKLQFLERIPKIGKRFLAK